MTVYRNASLKTLASALGVAPNLRLVCTSSAINPMAKYKPIRHRTNGPITEAERRGEDADIANGIVYGLKVGVDGKVLANIHSATWEYVGKPSGGIGVSPYRLLDFDGYDTNAVPDLYGELPTAAYYNIDEPFSVQLIRNPNNTTGVLLPEVIFGAGGTSANYEYLYLGVAINNYATLMKNKTFGGYYPVNLNGAEGKIFSCPPIPSGLDIYGAGNKTVTVFLMPWELSFQLQGNWVYLSGSSISATNVCSIPYCANKTVSFSYISTVPVIVTSFNSSVSGSSVVYTWAQGKDWGSYTKRLVVIASQIIGNSQIEGSGQIETTISSGTSTSYEISNILSQSGYFDFPGSGNRYNITAYFQYYTLSKWETAMYTSVSITY